MEMSHMCTLHLKWGLGMEGGGTPPTLTFQKDSVLTARGEGPDEPSTT